AVQTIPRRLWTHASVRRRKDRLEMSAARDRHWYGRIARDERSEARSRAPQDQAINPADGSGYQGASKGLRQNPRSPARHMLTGVTENYHRAVKWSYALTRGG